MSIRYSIAESPYRWLILAGISITAGLIGTMLMLAFAWPHIVASIWLWASLFLTAAFLVAALVEWKNRIEESLPPLEEGDQRPSGRAAGE